MVGTIALVAKQHRLELVLAATLSLIGGIAALVVTARLGAVALPGECVRGWTGSTPDAACLPYMESFGRIYFEEGGKVLAAMAVLPIALGLLAGVPIVGRELESGTAQFAWAIAPSRSVWLLRQVFVVGLIVAVVVGFSAAAAELLEGTRRVSMLAPPFENLGQHGPIALARALGAMAVGLLVGATTGRTLPAFIIGAVIMLGCVAIAGNTRDLWASSQTPTILDQAGSDDFDGQVVGLGWMDDAGGLVAYEDGMALVPASHVGDGEDWLIGNGYRQVQLGITRETARTWESIEFVGWIGAGFVLLGASNFVVSRRRPT